MVLNDVRVRLQAVGEPKKRKKNKKMIMMNDISISEPVSGFKQQVSC